ncbi:MAG: glycosyltransferase family 4 protein [Myxococcota bacterium]
MSPPQATTLDPGEPDPRETDPRGTGSASRLAFVAPPLGGPPTGGTRFNRQLVQALRARGEDPPVLGPAQARALVRVPGERTVWVDSLWMSCLPELRRLAAPSCRIGLLVHYLPVLTTHGEAPARSSLSPEETDALEHAEGLLVPSEYLAQELDALGVDAARIRVLEPGIELPVAARPVDRSVARPDDAPLHAIVIANITKGKGIAPLLECLAARLEPHDRLELVVIGGTQHEPDYAQRCADLVRERAPLRERVRLVGPRSYPECIEALLRADLLVSASAMESFGMALAEARACGRPILARTGGNVATHVDPSWGGALTPDEAHLAEALVALGRDRTELRARQQRAWRHRPHRPWAEVASRLLAITARWPPPRPPQ